jgi:hypothetical protein
MNRSSRTLLFVFVAFLVGCGSAAMHAAERGDSATLRAEIARKHDKGKLSNDEAADLAQAVAEHELTSAKDEATALARLHETRGCAGELDDALATVSKKHDGAGAEAALVRLESGRLGNGTARDWLEDPDDRFRAVGSRTLHRGSDRKRRQAAILDPSPRVRRSAIRASADAGDATDLDLLFETARVDPEPMLRNEALRSSSAILRELGDKTRANDFAVKIRDLWTAGDDAIKEDVAVAWGLSPVYENGGREALRVTLANGKGPGALAAAGVVLRSSRGDADLNASASALLAATIADGSRRDRLHALVLARLDVPSILDAVRKASQDDDRDIRVVALSRLMESKADRKAATKELYELARYGSNGAPQGGDDARTAETAVRARHALASAGELPVQAWLEEDLASSDPQRKLGAASALAALGRAARAAPLLSDADASIRTRAACTILVASRH